LAEFLIAILQHPLARQVALAVAGHAIRIGTNAVIRHLQARKG